MNKSIYSQPFSRSFSLSSLSLCICVASHSTLFNLFYFSSFPCLIYFTQFFIFSSSFKLSLYASFPALLTLPSNSHLILFVSYISHFFSFFLIVSIQLSFTFSLYFGLLSFHGSCLILHNIPSAGWKCPSALLLTGLFGNFTSLGQNNDK